MNRRLRPFNGSGLNVQVKPAFALVYVNGRPT